MNTPATTAAQRITRLIEQAIIEAKRVRRGPLYHMLARMVELDGDTERYKATQRVSLKASSSNGEERHGNLSQRRMTIDHAIGMRAALGFGIAILMKYRYRTPGVTGDEIDVALKRLKKAGVFTRLYVENLPVAV